MLKTFPAAKGFAHSAHWTFHRKENAPLKSLYLMGKSSELNKFEQAVATGVSPGLNISYANKTGDIAWWLFGRVPQRPVHLSPYRLRRGWAEEDQPLPDMAFSQKPKIINPKSGTLFTANQGIQKKPSIVGHYQDSFRSSRINHLLDSQKKWSVDDFKIVQNDSTSMAWQQNFDHLTEALIDYERQDVAELLRGWDGVAISDSIAATIFSRWIDELYHQLLSPWLDEKGRRQLFRLALTRHFVYRVLNNKESKWWDHPQTTYKETRHQVLHSALDRALQTLADQLGKDISNWTWSHFHQVHYRHPLGLIPGLGWLFNLGPFPAPGGNNLINAFNHRKLDQPGQVTSLPAVRRLVDFANANEGFQILPTGNSGHVLSRHYGDQVSLHLTAKYRKIKIQNNWDSSKPALKLKNK